MAALALTIGAFFATNIIIPLWLQTIMGYTATWAGKAASLRGFTALIAAPIAARLMTRVDPRAVISAGVIWLGGVSLVFAFSSTDMTFGHVAFWMFVTGFGFPLFFLPLIAMTVADVDASEVANASGLQNFIRTLATAVAISVSTTQWENAGNLRQADVAATIGAGGPMQAALTAEQMRGGDFARLQMLMEALVHKQAVMLATNGVFMACAVLYLLCAAGIWLVPRPTGELKGPGGH